MTERSPIVNFVTTRVLYLQTMFEYSSMSKATLSYSTYSEQAADAIIQMLKKGAALCTKEGINVMKAIQTPGVFSDQDRERIIDCVGETLDWEVEETKPTPPCTAIMGRAQPKKQTMDHIENYMTAKLWDGMAGGAGHIDLLPSLGKLLVD